MTYRPGDSYLIDDETGLKIRRSDAVKRWDGAIVHRNVTNPRHPQDFVRAKRDKQLADMVRPRTPDVFGGPLTTTLAAAADVLSTTLVLSSTVGMQEGDRIQVMLETGDVFDVIIYSILGLQNITIAPPLIRAAQYGARVVNLGSSLHPESYDSEGYFQAGYDLY
jgi:hypothetical protein